MQKRVGETNVASNGMEMTIIAYKSYYDIDIQFEDGKIVLHKRYDHFKDGNIKHPDKIIPNRVGEKNINNQGLEMEIIKYKNHSDMDVRFSTGYIFYHAQYYNFKAGNISEPNYKKSQKDNHIGMTKIANNGQKMTIIEYKKYRNISVKFEDGTIVYNKSMNAFNEGKIENPNYKTRVYHTKDRYLNNSYIHSSGLSYTIIKYNGHKYNTILFEDGFEKEKVSSSKLKNGMFSHPYIKINKNTIYSDNYFGFKIKNSFKTNGKIYFEVYIKDDFFALMTLQEIYTLGKEKQHA